VKRFFANEPLEPLIVSVRGRRAILDADLARLHGVRTKALNQIVRRNSDRFPGDFAFRLTATEAANLKSQVVTSSLPSDTSKSDSGNRSQIVTGSQKHRDPRFRPWAFTEHGALMAANVLRSRRAVQMSVYVIRAFVRLREQIAANQAVLKRIAEIDKTLLHHDTALRDLYRKLLPLLQPPPEPKKRKVGFLVEEKAAKYGRAEISARK
jgi:hypothetical protein